MRRPAWLFRLAAFSAAFLSPTLSDLNRSLILFSLHNLLHRQLVYHLFFSPGPFLSYLQGKSKLITLYLHTSHGCSSPHAAPVHGIFKRTHHPIGSGEGMVAL